MQLAEYIKLRREALGITRNKLSQMAGISHTEMYRIESGERKQPSISNLNAIADALGIPRETLISEGGVCQVQEESAKKRTFPSLQSQQQQDFINWLADKLYAARLSDEQLSGLRTQVEMYLCYAANK